MEIYVNLKCSFIRPIKRRVQLSFNECELEFSYNGEVLVLESGVPSYLEPYLYVIEEEVLKKIDEVGNEIGLDGINRIDIVGELDVVYALVESVNLSLEVDYVE